MTGWITGFLAVAAMNALLLSPDAAAAAATNKLDDDHITVAVETKLFHDDAVPSHKIDVDTRQGIVTLQGTVNNYYSKLEAANAAESIKGVLEVVNKIQVRPLARLDSLIQGDVVSALAVDPVTESYEIDVRVKDRVVTLAGKVDSYTEKTVAGEVAEGVQGVVDVKNELTFDVVSDRTDADIADDIRYRLRSDASIDAGLITVTVNDGKVTLAGSVGSAAEKREAQYEAWIVPGVRSIANTIHVKWWLDGGAADWTAGWTDDNAQKAVESALARHPRVNPFNITTTVKHGVATLTGRVDNLRAKRAAEEAVRDSLGVWRVKNHVRVQPAVTRTDAQLARDIRYALRRDPHVDRFHITVNVYNGKAYLTGVVDLLFMKEQAEEATARVAGVVAIQNNLDVDCVIPAKTDREIKDDIESQLRWSPFVDRDEVTVEVRSGVATLRGTVEDWNELQAAREIAREGGATSVISKLKVENGAGS